VVAPDHTFGLLSPWRRHSYPQHTSNLAKATTPFLFHTLRMTTPAVKGVLPATKHTHILAKAATPFPHYHDGYPLLPPPTPSSWPKPQLLCPKLLRWLGVTTVVEQVPHQLPSTHTSWPKAQPLPLAPVACCTTTMMARCDDCGESS
jgi:hypothetical protein